MPSITFYKEGNALIIERNKRTLRRRLAFSSFFGLAALGGMNLLLRKYVPAFPLMLIACFFIAYYFRRIILDLTVENKTRISLKDEVVYIDGLQYSRSALVQAVVLVPEDEYGLSYEVGLEAPNNRYYLQDGLSRQLADQLATFLSIELDVPLQEMRYKEY